MSTYNLNECSHSKTWKQACAHCDLIWWTHVKETGLSQLERADKHIAEAQAKIAAEGAPNEL